MKLPFTETMERSVKDRNILDEFCIRFCRVVERHCPYIVVSGFVAVSSGRTRGTEDIDMILPKLSAPEFAALHKDLVKNSFVCMQGENPEELYKDYLTEKTSIRYTLKDRLLPEMEIKLAKDELDEYQLRTRTKLQLTGLDIWFGSISANIAFKEEYLKSDKDLEDAKHLRIVYQEDKRHDTEASPMRKEHMEQVVRWAEHIRRRKGDDSWRKAHSEFINAQFDKSERFIKKLLRQPGGKEKIIKLFKIRNLKAYGLE